MKSHSPIRVLIVGLVIGGLMAGGTAAWATHVFDDVADDRFFSDAVTWAAANGITTGKTPDLFAPDDPVTRGESVTFLKRYHDALGSTPGPTGPQGDPGAQGDPGPQGDRGLSSWDVIPSGTTVTGNAGWQFYAGLDNQLHNFSVDLPGTAPVSLTPTDVNFAGTAATTIDDDPQCTGTAAVPTAPPGKVCLYLYGTSGADNIQGANAQNLGDRAFYVSWLANGTGSMWLYTTWAYTAP